jgi:hypothetical protein
MLTFSNSRCMVLFAILIGATPGFAQSQLRLTERENQELVKRIDRRTERFCRTFTAQSKQSPGQQREVNEHVEEFALLVSQLSDKRVASRYVADLLRSASLIEQLLLREGVAPPVVIAWASLHADLDLLARGYGIRWTDAVITPELLAELDGDAARFGDRLLSELTAFQQISVTANDLKGAMGDFQESLRALNRSYRNSERAYAQIEDIRRRARLIANYLKQHSVRFAVEEDWRQISSRLEELGRLYQLDFRNEKQP